jgi:hypothetical protein
VAWIYIGGIMPGRAIRLVSATCNPGVAFYVVVRNLDTGLRINVTDIRAFVDAIPTSCVFEANGVIEPLTNEMCNITTPTPMVGEDYTLKIVGPANEDVTTVVCAPV